MTEVEPRSSSEITQPDEASWKTTWMIVGGVVGALLGVMAVYMYVRTIESESGGEVIEPRPIKPGAAMQVVLAALTAVRQFANLGAE